MNLPSYQEPVARLLALEPLKHFREEWLNYADLGISAEHIPELLRMSLDPELHTASSDSALVWAPVHAWRALGQLRATQVIGPLLNLLDQQREDDWAREDLPRVFARLGATVLPDLSAFLRDPERDLWARAAVADAMKDIVQDVPERRSEVVATLSQQLAKWYRNDEALNALLICTLIELQATEAATIMAEAFAGQRVDLLVNGDWEDVQIELGLLSERQTPRLPRSRLAVRLSEPSALGGSHKRRPRSAAQKGTVKRKAEREARKRNRRHK